MKKLIQSFEDDLLVAPYIVRYKEAGRYWQYAEEDLLVDAIQQASCLASYGINEDSIEIVDAKGKIL